MKVKDKNVKEWVDVADKDCPKRPCYWPRPDPGSFTPEIGYRTRAGKREWLCGTREINGCPIPKPKPSIKKGMIGIFSCTRSTAKAFLRQIKKADR